jgi:trehalose 6-phosphate phosphatase
MPGDRVATTLPEFADYSERVHGFVEGLGEDQLRSLGVRVEDKGPIVALHWRGADDEEAARTWLADVASRVDGDGLATHWGRKVLEVRPPVPVSKARAVQELAGRAEVRGALFGGDDTTDLDAFDALDSLVASGGLDHAVRVGVASEEGPDAIVERADLVVQGTGGFQAVLSALADA